jgi:SAM-dependent methyltransferase
VIGRRREAPAVGRVDFGDLRRLHPIGGSFGFDRGKPVDRYYIEQFLSSRATAIRGRVLEFGEPLYTRMFGGDRVSRSEILDVAGATEATYTSRLEEGNDLPSETFDCIVCTQTLQYLYDLPAAVRTLHRILKPGGTVLATVPGITRTCQEHYPDSWFWSFTAASATRLFSALFAREALDVELFGNVLSASAFLYGLADADLTRKELDHRDPDFELIIGVRAVKARVSGS